MPQLHIRSDAVDEARQLVLEHHYSRKWPRWVLFVTTLHEPGGLFGDRGPAVAACVFGVPAATWKESILELQRLVRIPDLDTNLTSLIAASIAELRWKYRDKAINDLVISYADPEHGHHGGIYQAASWNYSGLENRAPSTPTAYLINGKKYHRRTVGKRLGAPMDLETLRRKEPTIEPVYPTAKHLYWKPINRRGKAKARRLGLVCLPYPKEA